MALMVITIWVRGVIHNIAMKQLEDLHIASSQIRNLKKPIIKPSHKIITYLISNVRNLETIMYFDYIDVNLLSTIMSQTDMIFLSGN